MTGLRILVEGTDDQELQGVLLNSLLQWLGLLHAPLPLQAPPDALEAVSYDVGVLSGLNAWLNMLMEEARAFHMVELLLQVRLL